MATSRRRTNKKSVGQNLNDLERRVKAVERRPTPSYLKNALIDDTTVATDSITLESLDPTLRSLILSAASNADTTGTSYGQTGINVGQNATNISTTGFKANSRTTVFYQTTAPDDDGRIDGDLWYDTDNDFKPWRWGFEKVSITQVVVSGTGSSRSAVFTTSAAHTIGTDEILRVEDVTGSGGIDLLNGDWDITAATSTTITVSIGSGTGITNGTYTGLAAIGTSNLGEWFPAPFGDAALTSLTVGKLLTGTLNVATVATVGDPLASTGGGTGGSIVISGGTGFTGIKLFKPDGTNTVFMNALTGDASFTGTITAATGSIGGWSIGASALTAGSSTSSVGLVSTSTPGTIAIYAGNSTPASAPFRVTNQGSLTASNATITGSITATSGAIGGFSIGADTLSAGATTTYVTVSSGTTAFSAGGATPSSAPFNVSRTGALTASNATITGTITSTAGTIGGWTLASNALTAGSGASTIGLVSTTTAGTIAIYAGDSTPASAPLRITNQGALTATNATITGSITATSGSIGGFTIGSSTLSAGSTTTYVTVSSGTTAFSAGGAAPASAPFNVSQTGALTATNATITGTITATLGAIGGWTIGSSSLTAGSGTSTVGLVSTSTAGTIAIYAGNSTPASAPFRVTNEGVLTASSATITGEIRATSGYFGADSSNGWTISGNTIQSKTVSGKSITLDAANAEMYIGTGTYNTSGTPFYADSVGYFSLGSLLSFDPVGTNNTPVLTVNGRIRGVVDSVAVAPRDSNRLVLNTVSAQQSGPSTITYTFTTFSNHPFVVGDSVVISGFTNLADPIPPAFPLAFPADLSGLNGTWTISSRTNTSFSFTSGSSLMPANTLYTATEGTASVFASSVVISTTSGVTSAVVTMSGTHGFLVGDTVIITGLTGNAAAANGTWVITAKTTTQFTISGLTGAVVGTYTGQTGAVRVRELTVGFHPAHNNAPAGIGIRLDENNYWFTNNNFKVGTALSYFKWDGTTLEVIGQVKATSGYIGGSSSGWLIGSDRLTNGDVGFYAPATPSGTDVAIFAGDTFANRTSAEFRVLYNGSLTATSATITGTVNATAGYIGGSSGGWLIGSNLLSNGEVGFNAPAPTSRSFSTTATGTSGTLTLSLSSATGFVVGQNISGPGIPSGTYITNLVGTTATLSQNLTTSGSRTVTAYEVAIFVGDTFINRYSSEFRVDYGGNLRATSATIDGVINATAGNFTGFVTAGTMRFGADVNSTNDGIYINANNYWYDTGIFSLGDGTNGVVWNSSTLTVTGTVNANAGNFTSTVTIGSGSTSGTLTVGTNATATNRITIAGTDTNTTTKIYAGVGNYNNADTPFYFDASGRFSLGTSATLSAGSLTITGTVNATGGNFTGYVTAGTMRFGANVSGTSDGLYINSYNYWYDDGTFRVGDSGSSLYWDGSTFFITGSSGITTQSTSSSLGGQLLIVPNSGATDLRFVNDRKQIATYAKGSGGVVTLTFSSAHFYQDSQWIKVYGLGSPYDGVFSITVASSTSFTYATGVSGSVAATNAPTGAGVTDEYYGSSSTAVTSAGYGYIGTTQATYLNPSPPGGTYKTIATIIASPRRYLSSASSATTRSNITMYSTGTDTLDNEFGPSIDINARFVNIGSQNTTDSATSVLGFLTVSNAATMSDNLSVGGVSTLAGGAVVSTRFRLPVVDTTTGVTNGDLAFDGTNNAIEVGIGGGTKRYLQPVVRGVASVSPNASGLDAVPTYYTSTANGGKLATAIEINGAVVDLLNSGGAVRAQVHNLNLGQGGGSQVGSIQVRLVNTTTGAAVTTGTYNLMYVAWV